MTRHSLLIEEDIFLTLVGLEHVCEHPVPSIKLSLVQELEEVGPSAHGQLEDVVTLLYLALVELHCDFVQSVVLLPRFELLWPEDEQTHIGHDHIVLSPWLEGIAYAIPAPLNTAVDSAPNKSTVVVELVLLLSQHEMIEIEVNGLLAESHRECVIKLKLDRICLQSLDIADEQTHTFGLKDHVRLLDLALGTHVHLEGAPGLRILTEEELPHIAKIDGAVERVVVALVEEGDHAAVDDHQGICGLHAFATEDSALSGEESLAEAHLVVVKVFLIPFFFVLAEEDIHLLDQAILEL